MKSEGIALSRGVDIVLHGNTPGGGMSRSASLTLNLILSLLDANGIEIDDPLKIVDLAQAVENDYIGSPCGQLDQIMIFLPRRAWGPTTTPETGRFVTCLLARKPRTFGLSGSTPVPFGRASKNRPTELAAQNVTSSFKRSVPSSRFPASAIKFSDCFSLLPRFPRSLL